MRRRKSRQGWLINWQNIVMGDFYIFIAFTGSETRKARGTDDGTTGECRLLMNRSPSSVRTFTPLCPLASAGVCTGRYNEYLDTPSWPVCTRQRD